MNIEHESFHVKPYNEDESKKKQVAEMFDNISGKYDFLNHILSLNIDKIWRKKAISLLKPTKPQTVLDFATGTGDLAIAIEKYLKPAEIIGIDISEGMINQGKIKIEKLGLHSIIHLEKGDSEAITFPKNRFDAVTVAFGARNFENLHKGLSEILRVLKPGGRMVILELSMPKCSFVKYFYCFYFSKILPFFGKLFSKDNSAYRYLPESVKQFPSGEIMQNIITETGFVQSEYKQLSAGIATIYTAVKLKNS